jgi:hypothetical protein
MNLSRGLWVACCFCGALAASQELSAQQITLPFSTTYNCPEQDQSTAGWVTCDGVGSAGGWKTSNGSTEQITTAANYPGGGGGRGQRHWIGQSLGNTNGSGSVSFSFSQVQEIYIQWYMRWQQGLKLGGSVAPIVREQKLVYFTGAGCGQPNGCYFAIEHGEFRVVMAGGTPRGGGTGWNGLFGGATNASSDGRWIRMEVHLKNETGGLNNGVAEWWVDGTRVLSVTNLDTVGSTGFSSFVFPENHQYTTVSGTCCDMYQDLDDVTIRTTPGGPVTVNRPPAAPTGLRVVR